MMSIIYQTDLEVIDGSRELYKNPIYFFSEFEKKRLLAVYELFEDSDLFFAETYVPRKGEDTLTFLNNYIDKIDSDLDKHKLKEFAKELYQEASE